MKVAVILFPGSNCSQDLVLYFQKRGHRVFNIWYQEDDISKYSFDLLAIPGGFSFGDRFYHKATDDYVIQPGKMALDSPVCKIILESHRQKIPILGICNGFQILTEIGLLDGALNRNINLKFLAKNCFIKKNHDNHFNKKILPDQCLSIPVAHNEGSYYNSEEGLKSLEDNQQISFLYCDREW